MIKIFSRFLDIICHIVVFFIEKILPKNIVIDRRSLREITRYFVVGVIVTLGYTFTVIFIVEKLGFATPLTANIIGFILWTPASYLGHKEFTFEYSGESAESVIKFFVVFIGKLIASILVIMAAQFLNYSYILGIIANWFIIPIVTFIVLKLWVFVKQ